MFYLCRRCDRGQQYCTPRCREKPRRLQGREANHRYERNSIVLTTNKGFKEWNTVFPNATCIAALLDRLTLHADVTLVEGDSYRMRKSQMEAEAAKKTSKRDAHAQRS